MLKPHLFSYSIIFLVIRHPGASRDPLFKRNRELKMDPDFPRDDEIVTGMTNSETIHYIPYQKCDLFVDLNHKLLT